MSSVNIDKTADYCPACGAEVDSAEEVAVDEDLAGQGVYKRENGHVIIDGGTIEIYQHVGGSGGDEA